ncbi:polysaccharide deacetylase family protein [Wukongibacter baidiensis]|uniref:polysaccharide deacetylase family protein n=1 Tax=Wukongibacter baidiensis TaxID=1723361 RepID=UPI003D7F2CE8
MEKTKILLIFILILSFISTTIPIAYGVQEVSIPILMYHNLVDDNEEGDGLNVSKERFEDQLRYLKFHGYHTIDFSEMDRYFKGEGNLPPNPIIITFDDGYQSNYQYGYPILKKYGYKATVFMITDYIGKEGYMSGGVLKKIQSDGVFDVESHSATHNYNLSELSHDEMVKDVRGSKQKLEELLEKPVNVFCYPYGRSSEKLRKILKDEGYTIAVTTQYGVSAKGSDLLRFKRLRVSGKDPGNSLIKRIEGNTKNFTKPIFKDVSIDDKYFLGLINGVDKGVIQLEDGKVYPDKEVTFDYLIECLSNIFVIQDRQNEDTAKAVTMESALKTLNNYFNISEFNIEEDALSSGKKIGLLSGIEDIEEKKILKRKELALLMDNLIRILDSDKGEYREKPLSKSQNHEYVFITGNYYMEDREAPKDVFALDSNNDSLQRITHFNAIGEYNLSVERIYTSPSRKKLLLEVRDLKDNKLAIKLIDVESSKVIPVIEMDTSKILNNISWLDNNKFVLQITEDEDEKILIYDTSARLLEEKRIEY